MCYLLFSDGTGNPLTIIPGIVYDKIIWKIINPQYIHTVYQVGTAFESCWEIMLRSGIKIPPW